MLGFLKGMKLVRTVKVARTATKVAKVSKLGLALKELPVIKLAAAGTVGYVIIDWWQSSRTSVADTLGITEDQSGILLVVAIAVALAFLVSILFGGRR